MSRRSITGSGLPTDKSDLSLSLTRSVGRASVTSQFLELAFFCCGRFTSHLPFSNPSSDFNARNERVSFEETAMEQGSVKVASPPLRSGY